MEFVFPYLVSMEMTRELDSFVDGRSKMHRVRSIPQNTEHRMYIKKFDLEDFSS